MTQARVDYHTYLASREWRLKRKEVIKEQDGRCNRCRTKDITDVHHLTYKRLGNEGPLDLVGLCRPCHEFISGERDDDPAIPVIQRVIREVGIEAYFRTDLPEPYPLWWLQAKGRAPWDEGIGCLVISVAPENTPLPFFLAAMPRIDLGSGLSGVCAWI